MLPTYDMTPALALTQDEQPFAFGYVIRDELEWAEGKKDMEVHFFIKIVLGSEPKAKALKKYRHLHAFKNAWLWSNEYVRCSVAAEDSSLKGAAMTAHTTPTLNQTRWRGLSERQRGTLTLLREIEVEREAYFRSPQSPKDLRKGGAWRWLKLKNTPSHDLPHRLKQAGLMDDQTNATFDALEELGYLEQRRTKEATNLFEEAELLELKLTRVGRKLAKEALNKSFD